MARTYQIIDWAGNLKFDGMVFTSFEDAWGYLVERFPNDDDLQEFEVIENE